MVKLSAGKLYVPGVYEYEGVVSAGFQVSDLSQAFSFRKIFILLIVGLLTCRLSADS